MKKLLRRLLPVSGSGSLSWTYCQQNLQRAEHIHVCGESKQHGYQHQCVCGFRWAA